MTTEQDRERLAEILGNLEASQTALREIYDATEGDPQEAGTPKSYLDDALTLLASVIKALEMTRAIATDQ